MNNTKHLWRIFFLVLIAGTVLMVGRILLIPNSFGKFGHFRGDNVAEQMAFPVKHFGPESCEPCHADEFALWKAGPHKTIICEDCHAPLVTHIKNDEKFADMEINKTTEFCLRCHSELPARPKDFPQINVESHLKDAGEKLTSTVCYTCHGPHDPTPKDPVDTTKAALKTKEQ